MKSKPAKADMAAVEFVCADLDPHDDESPKAAKARYLKGLDSVLPRPTACVDSGNGLQMLWRLDHPIILEPDAEGTEKIIAEVESRTKNVMLRLDAKTGTQDICHVLRLPGTRNLPNAAKMRKGRVACDSALLWFEDTTHPLSAFPPAEPHSITYRKSSTQSQSAAGDDGEEDELARTIRDGGEQRHGKSRSESVHYVINESLRRGYLIDSIVKTLMDRSNLISSHVYDQPGDPLVNAKRQVERARKRIELACDDKGVPFKSPENINVAMLRLGVTVRYDQFTDRLLIDGLEGFGPAVNDSALLRLWLTMVRRFKLKPPKGFLSDIIADTACLNGFHPVRDYLDGLAWDGKKRIDTWLATYGGAADDEYTSAVGALMLTGAVRRVRRPGCKFDEMVVLENPEQGTNKSSSLAVLAVHDDWFSDSMPMHVDNNSVIEALRGKWIIEVAELSGLRRTDIDHVKGLLSRRTDRGRLAYAHFVSEVARQCICVGTTNAHEYLRDNTGNRRYWPVACGRFDLAGLTRDRDQLWAEAAAREASGVSIRLPRKLWAKAGEEQKKRLTDDPYLTALQHELGELEGKIASQSLWTILDMRIGQMGQDQARRVSEAMRAMGWRRPNKSMLVKIGGKPVAGWVKGEKPWPEITANRDLDGRLCVLEDHPDN